MKEPRMIAPAERPNLTAPRFSNGWRLGLRFGFQVGRCMAASIASSEKDTGCVAERFNKRVRICDLAIPGMKNGEVGHAE
jgi:hypothetical protein